MQWTPEAEKAIRKVPFFVRKKVRARVEEEARQAGAPQVTIAEVKATQQRYMKGMAREVTGYQTENCFGPSGCPLQIRSGEELLEKVEKVLHEADLLGFLKSKGVQDFKFHHNIRVALACCPNACSQPQIKDIGLIAADRPTVGKSPCSACGACVAVCREAAIRLQSEPVTPCIDPSGCVACGQCITACPTGTLESGHKGYRVQLGGKLGRHPQLARELPGIYDEDTVVEIIKAAIEIYKHKNRHGERFGELLTDKDLQLLAQRFAHAGRS